MSDTDRTRRIELVNTAEASHEFTENKGVTVDSGYHIQSVSARPSSPAMPANSPSPTSQTSQAHGASATKD